ncbi:MAG TPA: WD40 repeat domain-containing serine/threonine-protein kinase [Kofleriaceae bacterium]|nr:WD40 repeat domain-containing serine/threonine-protein kinase [Kofleriaceae bacterium]
MTRPDSLYGRQLGEFVLRERIDGGGQGSVYLADQIALGRRAAVKVLHHRADCEPDALRRFAREARLASKLDHPYAAHVYAVGVEPDGIVWIAMELVNGITLKRWLDEHGGTMSLEALVPLLERVAQVVHAAHERGIVHRDIKPANIMLTGTGELLPKLLDFGLSKALGDVAPVHAPELGRQLDQSQLLTIRVPSSDQTSDSVVLGTPPYMAPELWTGTDAGPAADVYALGVIAFQALTGRQPFRGDTAEQLGRQHLTERIPTVGGTLPTGLDAVFARALAKRPSDRYHSTLELAGALRTVADARVVSQIRTAARAWVDRGRPADLLWRGSALADLDGWYRRTGSRDMATIEIAFVQASLDAELDAEDAKERSRKRAIRLGTGLSIALAALIVGTFEWRAAYETRIAQQRADDAEHEARATALTAEIEQGRAALLGQDYAAAQAHLGEAWRSGDRSRSTAFMLARAIQPLRAELAQLTGAGRMWSASWSPDGQRIATTDDQGARIWDAGTYRPLSQLPHGDVVYSAVWLWAGRLVTACGDGAVRIWSAGGALEKELRIAGKSPRWYAVAVSGERVAAVDASGSVAAVWSAEDGRELAEIGLPGRWWTALTFSADGQWLAVSGGGPAEILNTTTWRRVAKLGDQVRAIAWDPSGPQLIAGEAGGNASIWSIPSGTRKSLHRLGEAVTAVAFSVDGKLAAVAGEDGTEQAVEVASDRLVSRGNYLRSRIASISFSSDGARMVVSGASGELALLDSRSGLLIGLLDGPHQQLRGAEFDPFGQRVIAASWDGTARVWDAGSPYRRWSAGALSSGYGLFGGTTPDGRYLAIACPGCATRVWDTAHDRLLAELPSSSAGGPDSPAPFPVVSAAGDRAAIARGNAAEIYELPGGRLLRTVDHGARVTALAFGPGGLVIGDASGTVTATGRGQIVPAIGYGVDALAALPGGRLAVADTSGRVRVLDAAGSVVASFIAVPRARMMRGAPDGRRLLAVPHIAGKSASIALLDLEHGTQTRLDAPPAYSVRWVDGGRAILSAHADGAARLWNADGSLVRSYVGGSRFLADSDLSPDGSLIIGGGGDGLLRFWDTTTGQPLWVVAAHRPYVMGLHFEGEDIVTRGAGGEIARWKIPPADAVIRGGTWPLRSDMVRAP